MLAGHTETTLDFLQLIDRTLLSTADNTIPEDMNHFYQQLPNRIREEITPWLMNEWTALDARIAERQKMRGRGLEDDTVEIPAEIREVIKRIRDRSTGISES